jgi:hypothetical protein
MKILNKDFLSKFKQDIHKKSEELKRRCFAAADEESLLAGTPVQTYKTCGKLNCKCSQGGDQRHGPYLAVQIRRDGKQRNLTLKKSESYFFEMAREYQRQMKNRDEIILLQKKLLEKVDHMIEARVIWDKK